MPTARTLLAVIGAGNCDDDAAAVAFEVGRQIALHQCILVSGGRDGVMKAASQGAKSAGGLVIGILPGDSAQQANEFVDVPIVTGMGEARNVIIARTAHGLIALPGEAGTLSEIALGLKFGKPIAAIGAWSHINERIHRAISPQEAVEWVLNAIPACGQ